MKPSQTVLKYVIATAIVLGAIGIRSLLHTQLQTHLPYAFSLFAVLLCGWIGGLKVGLYATGLSAILVSYLFIPPYRSFDVHSTGGLLSTIVFAGMGLFISIAFESFIRNRQMVENAIEELRVSEGRFKMMADSAPVMIWISDVSRQGIWFNKPWLEFTGRDMADELGNGWTQGIHPEDMDKCVQIYASNFDARKPFEIDYRLRNNKGEYRWVADSGVPLYNSEGEFKGYIGSCVDITLRKQSEADQRLLLDIEHSARKDAEYGSKLKDDFLATLSHELRSPLSAIIGWAHILATGKCAPNKVAEAIEIIQRNAKAQAKLIDDLLDMNQIVSGKIRLDCRETYLEKVMEDSVASIQPQAEANGISLHVTSEINEPVYVDPQRMQQIIGNLLNNAIKFTPSGGEIHISASSDEENVQITVTDNGNGIASDFFPHIFERFQQADNSICRSYRGLGLGLAIVKQLVELHGGEIEAQSQGQGYGSSFIIKIPRSNGLARKSEEKREDFYSTSLQQSHVLVVDDEEDARYLLKEILVPYGADVQTASSAAEALKKIRTGSHPDIIVSDISMPGQSGYDLMRMLRTYKESEGGNIPSIALTALSSKHEIEKALQAGFNIHLPKPINPDTLVQAIKKLLKR